MGGLTGKKNQNVFNSAFKTSFLSEDSNVTEETQINSPLSGYNSEYSIMNITGNTSLPVAVEQNEQVVNNNDDNNSNNDSKIIN